MTAQLATAMQPETGSVHVRHNSNELFEPFDSAYALIARKALQLSQVKNHLIEHELDDWLAAEIELLYPVHIEMTESEKDFKLRAEVPGFKTNDLEIKVEPRCVRIAGKRETKEAKGGRTVHSEWRADQILRAVGFPSEVDTAHVNASLKDGILVIDLPKAPHSKAMRIEPRSA
jgi:HSP20 family protein